MKITEIDHPSHPHRLSLIQPNDPFSCDGCKELGFGPCYQCSFKNCNYHIHEQCASAPSTIFHPFLKSCSFNFYEQSPGYRAHYCYACGKDIHGYLYQCSHKKAHDLHPCCAKLQRSLADRDGTVKLILRKDVKSKCLKCGSKEIFKGVKGWSYVSSCGDFCYHVACVKEANLEKWKKSYFELVAVEASNGLALQNGDPTQQVVAVQSEESPWVRKTKNVLLILKLIVSAIFGDPVSSVAALIHHCLIS